MKTDKFTLDLKRQWGPCPRCGGSVTFGNFRSTKRRPRILPAYQSTPSRRSQWNRVDRPASRPIRVAARRTEYTSWGKRRTLWLAEDRCPECQLRREHDVSYNEASRRASRARWAEIDPPEGPPVPKPHGVARARREAAAESARARSLKHRARRSKDRR